MSRPLLQTNYIGLSIQPAVHGPSTECNADKRVAYYKNIQ